MDKRNRNGRFEQGTSGGPGSHLPEAIQGPITFAYLTGWRTPSEVLTLRRISERERFGLSQA